MILEKRDTQKMGLVNACEATIILGCSRGFIDRLQLKGELIATPTVYAKYYFKKDAVLKLKEALAAETA